MKPPIPAFPGWNGAGRRQVSTGGRQAHVRQVRFAEDQTLQELSLRLLSPKTLYEGLQSLGNSLNVALVAGMP